MGLNCWEMKKCGKEDDCSAPKEKKLDGVHSGENGGRSCWMLRRTLCNDVLQTTFSGKFDNCKECFVYKTIKEEEGENFKEPFILMDLLFPKA